MLNDEQLKFYNDQGLIPGPSESEEDFSRRAIYCMNLKKMWASEMPLELKDAGLMEESPILQEAFPVTKKLYGVVPHWMILFFSDEKLLPWHAGSALIFQMDDHSSTAAILQLREALKDKEAYLGLITRKELIAHEICHAGRMMFEEPKFEEMLAYRSSNSWFSRYVGPIIRSSTESLIFVLTLFFAAFIDLIIVFYAPTTPLLQLFWIKLIPLGLVAFAIARLLWCRSQFSTCLKKLTQLFESEEKANAVTYRLTDQEIEFFSKSDLEEIKHYMNKQVDLRWRCIKLC